MLCKYGNPIWTLFGGIFISFFSTLWSCFQLKKLYEMIVVYSSSRRNSKVQFLSPLIFLLTILRSLHQLSKQRTLK